MASLAMLATLLGAGLASAQPFNYIYQFATTGGTPSPTFTIPVGTQTADVAVYLQETGTGATLRNIGLAGVGVQLLFNNPSGVASVAAAADISNNPSFEVVFTRTVTANDATLIESTFNLNGVQSPVPDPLRILVGTFKITRLTSGAGTVTLRAQDRPGTSDTNLNNGTVIDSQINFGTATLTVAGVPEPTSLVLAGLGAAGLAAFRRRKKAKVEEVAAE